jgi:flavin-dependent dehydrogenase
MQMLDETDVFVAGGGPAGLAAAIAARAKGFRVVVADWSRPPIEKPCGEGLMPDSLAALRRLGVTLGPEQTFPFRGIRFLEPGTLVSASFPLGCGLGIRRPLLHQLLVDRASETGISFLWGARVGGVRADGVMVDGRLVRSRWIIGADGQNSYVRRWADLDGYRSYKRRFGFRRHYRIAPWSDCVEIYWGTGCQFYVTPVSPQEVCVVLISSDRHLRLDPALSRFPELMERLEEAVPTSYERGAISVSCSFTNVVRDRVALIGDASGSVDAITGDGLCLAFQQALALADALESGNLSAYEAEHRRLMRRPAMMARLMLILDKSPLIRGRALRALAANPGIFSMLLAAHVGACSPVGCVIRGAVPLGWRMLTAGRPQGGTCLETL